MLSFREEVKNASVFQWSARGLKPRMYVLTNQFSIIVISEPNMSAPIKLSRYECFISLNHGECSKVFVFICRNLTYVHRPVPPDEQNQYICLTVKENKTTFTILGAYLSLGCGRHLGCGRLRGILGKTLQPRVTTGELNAYHYLWRSSKVNI